MTTVHRRLLAALNRLLALRVWTRLEAQPGFNEGLRRAEAELEAGGGVLYEVRDGTLYRLPGQPFKPFRHRVPHP